MPNRRTPDHLKLLKGTYKPSRAIKPAPASLKPLGEPPRRLRAGVRRIWRETAKNAPHLRYADRFVVELYAELMHQFRTDLNMQTGRIGHLRLLMNDLFLTPGTRPNIPPDNDKPGAFDDL